MDQDATWYGYIGLGPGDILLDGDPAPQTKVHNPQFSAHVYCDKMAVCIRIPLGTEAGLNLGDNVLDGVPAPPKRGTAPGFRSMSVVTKRLDG